MKKSDPTNRQKLFSPLVLKFPSHIFLYVDLGAKERITISSLLVSPLLSVRMGKFLLGARSLIVRMEKKKKFMLVV